ncbi:MAG: hypothetical protein ACYS1A_08540 [Planctomycetota bacterium]
MRKKTDSRRFLTVVCVTMFSVLGFWTNFVCGREIVEAPESDLSLGQVRIEGKYIERLVLQGDGESKRFDQPEENISLAPGEYRLWEVHLEDRYVCYAYGREGYGDSITVDEEKPAVLKVGAPLKQRIKVRRQGDILVLSYELVGLGGESYSSRDRTKPPTFAVYKGDKKIGSGSFEYG